MTLIFFHRGEHDLSNGYAAEYLNGKDKLRESYPELQLLEVSKDETSEVMMDVLVVENALPDILQILKATRKYDLDLTIGIAYGHSILDQLLLSLTSPPKVVTLDFELVQQSKSSAKKRFEPTERLVRRIGNLAGWRKTVILGVTNWARDELSHNLAGMIRERGDSVFQKQDALWTLIPEILEDALLRHELRQRLETLDALVIPSDHEFHGIIGMSAAMRSIYGEIQKLGPSNATVLICGESGTGKELVAKAIYTESKRAEKPFLPINCPAIPGELIESELFGHEKGAFTGATKSEEGKFELANGGTIFLDEVGDMSAGTQAKVLRVLQEQEFERVGGKKLIKVDVRVIAATNKDLFQLMQKGGFREDLYYRLAVCCLNVPPLRDHRNDIPLYAKHFVTKHRQTCNPSIKSISDKAINILMRQSWRGNIRELENCIIRTMIHCVSEVIDAPDIKFETSPSKELHDATSGITDRWTYSQCCGKGKIVRNETDKISRLLKLLFDATLDATHEKRQVSDDELRSIGIDVSTTKGRGNLTSKMSTLRKEFEANHDAGWTIPDGERHLRPR